MQDVVAERLSEALVTQRAKSPEAPWTAPLGTLRLLALLFLTCGVYAFFYLYKIARDLRDHADRDVTPWLYPLSILIGLANAIAGARLANLASGLAPYEQRKPFCSGGVVFVLVFGAHLVLTISGTLVSELWFIPGVLLYAIPWLLIEHQLNAIKVRLSNATFRAKPNRFTNLQWVAVALGAAFWALILYGMVTVVARWSGTELAAGVAYEDPQGRFSMVPGRDGWVIVSPGTVVEDAALELVGPGSLDWAVMHVTDQAGWELDEVVDNRYAEVSALDEDVEFSELRELVPDTNIAISYTRYSGRDVFDGPFFFYATAFVTDERVVELIVYSAGVQRVLSGAEQLARSLKPPSPKENAVDE